MPIVTTVTGDVDSAGLGIVLPHEHLQINTLRENRGTGLLNDPRLMAGEVEEFLRSGGGTIVELTVAEIAEGAAPDPSSRAAGAADCAGTRPAANVLALAQLAQRTGVRLILGTGHYRDPYLDRDWFDRHDADEIAELMVRDLTEGFPGTGVRAGVIGEIGAERWYISAAEERSFRAAARAHLRTGATVTTHAARWPVGTAQLALLAAEGVDPRRVIIGHCDMVHAPGYHAQLARQGAYVQFDTFHQCTTEHALRARIDAIMALARAGYLEQILVSHDVFLTSHLSVNGGVGLAYLTTRLPGALLDAGLDRAEVELLLSINPQRALAR